MAALTKMMITDTKETLLISLKLTIYLFERQTHTHTEREKLSPYWFVPKCPQCQGLGWRQSLELGTQSKPPM